MFYNASGHSRRGNHNEGVEMTELAVGVQYAATA